MPRRRTVEQDFLAAFERLKNGRPNHPRLVELGKRGCLRVNVSTVALEAGRSRTLIGTDTCRYLTVRRLIQQEGVQGPARITQESVINSLRERIADLRGKLQQARSLLAAQRITIEAMSSSAAARPSPDQ